MVAIKAIARLLARVAVLAAALTLIVAAALKGQDSAAFHDALAAHGVLPVFSLGLAPWAIIALEAVVGAAALLGIVGGNWRSAAGATGAIFLCFAVYATALAIRPPAATSGCGCGFGAAVVEDWTPLAARNGAAALILFVAGSTLPRSAAKKEEPKTAEPIHV